MEAAAHHLLGSDEAEWVVRRDVGRRDDGGRVAVLLQEVEGPVQEVADVVCEGGVDDVPEPLL